MESFLSLNATYYNTSRQSLDYPHKLTIFRGLKKIVSRNYWLSISCITMSKLIIHGGKKLQGTVTPVPNKNSIIKLIPAALLTDEDLIIHNVPKTSDVGYMLEILKLL